MPTRPPLGHWALEVTALERQRARVQCERNEIQGAGTQTGIGTVLEVFEIGGINAGLLRQVLGADAELISAVDDTPGQVAGLRGSVADPF